MVTRPLSPQLMWRRRYIIDSGRRALHIVSRAELTTAPAPTFVVSTRPIAATLHWNNEATLLGKGSTRMHEYD